MKVLDGNKVTVGINKVDHVQAEESASVQGRENVEES